MGTNRLLNNVILIKRYLKDVGQMWAGRCCCCCSHIAPTCNVHIVVSDMTERTALYRVSPKLLYILLLLMETFNVLRDTQQYC
jgi:hypothetical protein